MALRFAQARSLPVRLRRHLGATGREGAAQAGAEFGLVVLPGGGADALVFLEAREDSVLPSIDVNSPVGQGGFIMSWWLRWGELGVRHRLSLRLS
uniref:Uncharacterized protein n=1 Tax=Streptomyces auratus AGR0001 TaxID=1160718 RepID=J1ZM00_9ACTN